VLLSILNIAAYVEFLQSHQLHLLQEKENELQRLIPRIFSPFKAYWLRDAATGLTFNNRTLCVHRIYVFCIYLTTNSDLCHLQHKLIGFYNRDEKCLQRGTDWVFK
jgi:hypothetical protein